MEIRKNIIYDLMWAYSSAKRQTMRSGSALCQNPISFMNGCTINDISYDKESGWVRRKVRRIVEKRACQRLHNQTCDLKGNSFRFRDSWLSANQVKRICGINPNVFSA